MEDWNSSSSLQLSALLSGLGGGLALFLLGMRQLSDSLGTATGGSMKNLLARLTANRFTAALAGTVVTTIVQSSSVTTVLVVGFVSAGLLSLSQSIGVIIGANVGTTITAQIIAFHIYQYGLLLIALGFLIEVLAKRVRTKQLGTALLSLGLIFFGMQLMSAATEPLRESPLFLEVVQNLRHPMIGIVIGFLFTAIVQSSSATTGIVIVLASQGLISLESGIGIIFGANIGTCVTATVSAIGRTREAVQAALIHVIFNVGGVLLWMFFIPSFADLIRAISPTANYLDGTARLAAETPRQIANAHSLFNFGNAFLFIWFTGPLAKVVNWIVPKRKAATPTEPKFLDEMYLDQPALALDSVRRELVRLAELNEEMLSHALTVVTVGSRGDIAVLAQSDDGVDQLYAAIVTYLGKLSQKNLVAPQPTQLYQFIGIANQLESVGDIIVNDLLVDAVKRIQQGVVISPQTAAVLRPLHAQIKAAFHQCMAALSQNDLTAARAAVESKSRINELGDEASHHLAKRLVGFDPNRLATFQVETGIIENLKRINTITRRIARAILDLNNGHAPAVEEASS